MQGASPCGVRSSQPPLPSVAYEKEVKHVVRTSYEAYTGNHVGHKGTRTPEVWYSLVTLNLKQRADGDGVIMWEAHAKESLWRDSGGSVGVDWAWHAWREASGTWETSSVPAVAIPALQRFGLRFDFLAGNPADLRVE